MTHTVWESMPQYFVTSATAKAGKEELLNYIDSLNQDFSEI